VDNKSNNNINVGAYGWRHPHWLGEFYHEDLPQEWQLNYYSNVFNCVLVPADYWHAEQGYACETWLDDVHEDFVFYLQLPENLPTYAVKEKYLQQIALLRPRIAGIVINEKFCIASNVLWLESLAAVAPLYLNGLWDFNEANCQSLDLQKKVVYQVWSEIFLQASNTAKTSVLMGPLAILHDDLSDLRRCRQTLESYFDYIRSDDVHLIHSIIVIHPTLSAERLSQIRAVIEIMGL